MGSGILTVALLTIAEGLGLSTELLNQIAWTPSVDFLVPEPSITLPVE
jgi:hypothetical protein